MKKKVNDQQQSEMEKSSLDELKALQIEDILKNETFQELILDYKAELLLRTLHVKDGDELVLLHNSVKSADELVSFFEASLDKYRYDNANRY